MVSLLWLLLLLSACGHSSLILKCKSCVCVCARAPAACCMLQTDVHHGNLNTWSACTGRPVKRDVASINAVAWSAPSRRVKNLHGSNYHEVFSKEVEGLYTRAHTCACGMQEKERSSPGSLVQTLFYQ